MTDSVNKIATPTNIWAGTGLCKTLEQARQLAAIPEIDTVMVGSITMEGVHNPTVAFHNGRSSTMYDHYPCSLGFMSYKTDLPAIISLIQHSGKKAVVSIAGKTADENGALAELAIDSGADGIELYLGNQYSFSNTKRSVGAHLNTVLFRSCKYAIEAACKTKKDVMFGLKFPYLENAHCFSEVAKAISWGHTMTYVATMDGMIGRPDKDECGDPVISVSGSDQLVGIAGKAIYYLALQQVYQFRKVLPKTVAVVGMGGIYSKRDKQAFFDTGASAVQIVSAYCEHSHSDVFSLIHRGESVLV